MSHYGKEFKRFAKHRFGRRKFPKFIILGLMMLFALAFLASAFGARGRHAHYDESLFRGHYSQDEQVGGAYAPRSNRAAKQAPQPNQPAPTAAPATQSNVPNEMLILSNALVRSVQNRHITQEQADAIVAQELRHMMDSAHDTNAAAQAPQAEVGQSMIAPPAEFFNAYHQDPQDLFRRGERNDRRGHGFLGFLIGGIFKLALLFLLFKLLSRFFGFNPWKSANDDVHNRTAGYAAWGEETAVEPLDDEIFKEELPVKKQEPAKEEPAAESGNAPMEESSPQAETVRIAKVENDNQADHGTTVEKDEK